MSEIDIFIQQMLSHAIQSDIPHYTKIAVEMRGPVLELGVGLGRTLLPIAQKDINCTGIDHQSYAIDHLLKTFRQQERSVNIRLVHTDMRDFNLDETFNVIQIPLRTYQLLNNKSDRLRCLLNCHKHLNKNGVLAMHLTEMQVNEATGLWRLIIEQPTTDDKVLTVEECLAPISSDLIGIRHRIHQYSSEGLLLNSWLHRRNIVALTKDEWKNELSDSGFVIKSVTQLSDSDVLIQAKPAS